MTEIYIDKDVYDKELNSILAEIASQIQDALSDNDDYVVEAIIDGTYYVFGNVQDYIDKNSIEIIQCLKKSKKEHDVEVSEPDFCGEFYADCFGIDFYKTSNLEYVVQRLNLR